MMIEKLIEATKAKHLDNPVPEEQYAAWKANPVTIRLMEELELEALIGAIEVTDCDYGDNIDMRRGSIFAANGVIEWMPQELCTDED